MNDSLIWEAFVARALTNRQIFLKFREHVTPPMFKDTLLSRVFSLVDDFVKEYNKLPSMDEFSVWMRTLSASEKERAVDYIDKAECLFNRPPDLDDKVLTNEVVEAIGRFKLEELLLDGAAMVDSGRIDRETIMARMRDVLNITVDDDNGYELSDNPAKLIEEATAAERFVSISTGINGLDAALHGGWFKRQFSCGIGPSGSGKSAFLVNHAVGAAMDGQDVLLLTCELPDLTVIERVLKRITKMERPELIKNKDKAAEITERFFRLTHSRMIVKYAKPGTFSAVDLEVYLDKLQILKEFTPDIVIIDYLDEMQASADDRRKDLRFQHQGLARDLGTLAKDRDIAVVSATQTTRDSVGKKRITQKDIGESWGKVKVSDVIYAICQTDEEEKGGQARIYLCKVRDGPGRGREIPVRVDFAKMIVESLEPKTYKEDDEVTW